MVLLLVFCLLCTHHPKGSYQRTEEYHVGRHVVWCMSSQTNCFLSHPQHTQFFNTTTRGHFPPNNAPFMWRHGILLPLPSRNWWTRTQIERQATARGKTFAPLEVLFISHSRNWFTRPFTVKLNGANTMTLTPPLTEVIVFDPIEECAIIGRTQDQFMWGPTIFFCERCIAIVHLDNTLQSFVVAKNKQFHIISCAWPSLWSGKIADPTKTIVVSRPVILFPSLTSASSKSYQVLKSWIQLGFLLLIEGFASHNKLVIRSCELPRFANLVNSLA